MRLSDLLQTIQPVRITGSTSMEITGVNIDSRLIGTGHLFMAMRGTQTDGHAYIPAAIDKGAVAVLCEELPEELKAGITYIQVKDSEDAVGKVATTFYGDPTSKMELIGVTGTNGKTTVAPLIGTPHISNSIYCLNIMMIFGINSLPYAADHTIERSFFYIIPISIP